MLIDVEEREVPLPETEQRSLFPDGRSLQNL